jgi:hypothetical protein
MTLEAKTSRTFDRMTQRLATAAVALAVASGAGAADSSAKRSQMPITSQATATVQIKHRTLNIASDFDAFNGNLVRLLGRYDPADTLIAATDQAKALDRLHASQGEQGLMLFEGSNDHGALFPLVGRPARKAIRYHMGNPLIAVKMTQKNIGAALYAPLTILVYEDTPGSVRVEYDLPSSSFGQFHDPEIDKVAVMLDSKLVALFLKAAAKQS